MGNVMRRQASREMQEAKRVSASGQSSENRAASLTVAVYCNSLNGNPHNLALFSVWNATFSPAAA